MERALDSRRIVIIGSGNVATQFARHLTAVGNILQVCSQTNEHAARLADEIGCQSISSYDAVVKDADIYLIAVKDDALPEIVNRFAGYPGLWLHTSGTTPMSIFEGKMQNHGVVYPLQTLTRQKAVAMSDIPIFIEAGNTQDLIKIRDFITRMGAKDIKACSSAQRMKLHIAAVFACNFVNFMLMHGQKILNEAGAQLSDMRPLIAETISKALADNDLETVQTGPARRGDTNIIETHLKNLEGESHDIYKFISEKIISHFSDK